ncbi:MAG: FkbM family methyltransferase, partial [Sphaerospermopsis kisseleviana]
DLGFQISIGNDLACPIVDQSSLYSFSEIFLEDEYKRVFEIINLPSRWLDLGCHYGFFSLYTAGLHAKVGQVAFQALLVDADSRVRHGVDSLIRLNRLDSCFMFHHGAIASGSGQVRFLEQDVMSSSLTGMTEHFSHPSMREVPIADESAITALMPPPYDLVKIDVEGGEYDFFSSYDQVLAGTANIVVEWHSWHRGGGGMQQIIDLAEARGFRLLKEIHPAKFCGHSDDRRMVGVLLFSSSK